MPAQYLAIRDRLAKVMPMTKAKAKAARIYNAKNPNKTPVTSNYERKRKRG